MTVRFWAQFRSIGQGWPWEKRKGKEENYTLEKKSIFLILFFFPFLEERKRIKIILTRCRYRSVTAVHVVIVIAIEINVIEEQSIGARLLGHSFVPTV